MINYNYYINTQGFLYRFAYFVRDDSSNVNHSITRLILYLNGRGEWIEKNFFDLVRNISLPLDCALLTLDHVGQGASSGTRADILDYSSYADNIFNVLNIFCNKYGLDIKNLDYVIIAHSMGGLIGLYSVLTSKIPVPRLIILSSPLLGIPYKLIPMGLLKCISYIYSLFKTGLRIPKIFFRQKKFEDNDLTGSKEWYDKIIFTPFPIGRPTYRWLLNTLKAREYVFNIKNLYILKCVINVMIADKETVVDKNDIILWFNNFIKFFGGEHSIIFIPNAKHELLCETPTLQKLAYNYICVQLYKIFFS